MFLACGLPASLASAVDGTLDTTFGTDGKTTTNIAIGSTAENAHSVVVQPDGKIVAAGKSVSSSNDYDVAVMRYNTDGTLDESFDFDGKVTTDIGDNSTDFMTAVVVQSDGKIVVAGHSVAAGGPSDLVLVRYNVNGSLDTTFDGDGKVVTDVGNNSTDSAGYSVVMQPDNKIVFAGSFDTASPSPSDIVVVRYNVNGSPDTTFDGDGKVVTDVGNNSTDLVNSVVLFDNKIIVTGYSNAGVTGGFMLVRYNSNGTLDESFDTDGKVVNDDGGYGLTRSVVVDSIGKIIVAGWFWDGTSSNFAVWRYDAVGSLDTSFGSAGKVTTDMGANSDESPAYSVVLQSDGKIVFGGHSGGNGSWNFAVVRYNVDGTLDTSFDSDGKVTTDIGVSTEDLIYSLDLQSDGKIVVAGYSYSGGQSDFALVRYNTNGSLDTTFDIDGKIVTDIGAAIADNARSVAVQSDGKIVVAGFSNIGATSDFVLVRYNVNGSLDTSFDSDGKVTTDIGTNSGDTALTVVLQSDGKIVAAGYSDVGGSGDFALVRYNVDGSLDTSFDSDGKVTTDIGIGSSDSAGYSVVLQSDGKIVFAGSSVVGGSSDIVVVRYNANGTLDTSFDSDGKVTTDIGTNSGDTALTVVLQSDGKIVAAGYSDVGGSGDFALVRYNVDGSLDATFDNDGKVVSDIGTLSDDAANSVVLQSDGKIVVAGYSDAGGSYDMIVGRFNANGSLDTSFDTDGKAVTDVGSNSTDTASSVVLQSDGKIVVAGYSDVSYPNDFVLVRYNANGTLDTTFDTDGISTINISGNSIDVAQTVVLQSDGKIVVAGNSNAGGSDDFTVVRYNAMSLSATLASSSSTSSSASITFNVTGTEAIDCATLSSASGVDFNFTGITEITSITQTSPSLCTIGATSQAVAGGVAVTSTLAVASSFSLGFANSNTRTTLSGSSQSVVVTIAAVVTSVSPTTTIAASTTTTIAPTTTVEAVVIASVRKLIATKGELPKTGSDSPPLLVLGTMFLVAGVLVSTRKRVAKR